MSTTTITTSYLSTDKWLVELTFNLPKEDYTNVLPIFVIDESGSMCNNLDSVVKGARQLIHSYLENNCPEVVVVCYHSTATSFYYHTLQEAKSFDACAEGMTNFPAAIDEIVTAIDRANQTKRQARVYFMTDGQNTVDPKRLPQAKKNLQDALANAIVPATMDVIGFTENHDVNLLNQFAKMTGEGTFQYAETGETLEEIVSKLLSVSGNKRTVDLTWDKQTVRATAIRDDDGTFRIIQQTSHLPSTEVKVHITGRDPIYLPMIKKELDEETRSRFQVQTIRDTLQELVQRANHLGITEYRDKFDTDLRAVDLEIDSLIGSKDIFQDMNRNQRRLIRQTHLEFKDTISQLYNARQKRLSTREHATLLSSASCYVTKTSLQKKLQQRVLNNMSNDDYLLAKERGKSLQFPNQPVDESVCMLTLENYQELAKQGDCLCICLSISRSQAAIADPSQVKICKIQPTLLSLDAFRDAVDLKLLDNNDGLGKSATVIQGMAREKINAVFPVYFDAESWSVARLRMKEAYSWMATNTWNGWSFSQVELLPAMVLAHALREYNSNQSEINKRIVDLLTTTCRAVSTIKIDKGILYDRQLEMLSEFMDSPINRTVDKVPSLQALLGIANVHNRKTFESRSFVEFVWEEYFRRELRWQQSNIETDEIMKTIAKKLHIDLNKYTCGGALGEASYSADAAECSDVILKELGLSITDVQRASFPQGTAPLARSGSTQTSNTGPKKWVWEPLILPGDVQQSQQIWLVVNRYFSHEPLSFLSNDICLAVTIQNMLQASNSSRREAVQKGEYISPFYHSGALIRGIGTKIIEHFRALELARHVTVQGNDAAEEFAATTDLFQAAGLIKTKIDHFGHHNLHRFARALAKPAKYAGGSIVGG